MPVRQFLQMHASAPQGLLQRQLRWKLIPDANIINENVKSPLHNVFILSVVLLISTESRLCLAFPLAVLKILTLFYLYACLIGGSKRCQKEAPDPLELELQVLKSHMMRAMRAER